jgi:hypothetical protein
VAIVTVQQDSTCSAQDGFQLFILGNESSVKSHTFQPQHNSNPPALERQIRIPGIVVLLEESPKTV